MGEDIPLVVGVDEAGRGPLLGDMIIACIVVDSHRIEELKRIGVRDSKSLSPGLREKLFKYIIDNAFIVATSTISPIEIDTYNLNELALKKIEELLKGIAMFIPTHMYIERVTIDMIKGYRKFITSLESIFPKAKVIFAEKADALYPEVSAASIVAKVYRDKNLYSFKKLLGDFGSGYPTDQKTVNWVKKMYLHGKQPPPILRRTWKVLERIAPEWYVEKQERKLGVKNRSLLDFI